MQKGNDFIRQIIENLLDQNQEMLFIITLCYISFSFKINILNLQFSFIYSFQRNYCSKMQKLTYQTNRQLFRCPSSPAYHQSIKYSTSTTINTSSSSIQSVDDQYRKLAIKWLMEFDRKVTKDTNYLSVWYLDVILKNGLIIKQSNWQLVAAAIMLFASKMNQIYPPSISSIIKRCKQTSNVIQKQSLIQMEGRILNMLCFNIAIQSPFNILYQILQDSKKDIEECQKLLKIIIYNKDINQQQSQILAYAMMYLVCRTKIDNIIKGQIRMKVKITAQKMYNYYKQVRKNYETQKNKEKNQNLTDYKNTTGKGLDNSSTKQNSKVNEINCSTGSYTKVDQNNIRKAQQNYIELSRVNSYKFIPKQRVFAESTNIACRESITTILGKQKKLYHCASKDDLNNNYKNMYFHA